ncbi:hypothetical protein PARC_b0270 [Pseudoalteromonas arctica A 37-1-2]|uniref:Uncharacterized protein n=1 Tax=Pseudoalteromonas arctica A 37-1-2 TaxID=1117313 RepID=A0A290S8S8_9GAMM|nr:hypothetical protein PARC_b0270 [Pseudoalteromonas arctica A 37-1-2]
MSLTLANIFCLFKAALDIKIQGCMIELFKLVTKDIPRAK